MKAIGSGYVIGKALAAWNPGDATVMVFVEPGYYPGPDMSNYIQNGASAILSGLTVSGSASLSNLNVSGATTLSNLTVATVTVTSNLTVQGLATVASLRIEGSAEVLGDIDLAGVGQSRNAVTKKFKASKDLHIGDVVIGDPNNDGQVTTTIVTGDTKVLGIALTDTLAGQDATIAIGGSVQVKSATMTIVNGDLLVSSSSEGMADRSLTPGVGSILGKALGKPNSNSMVWVLITLN